MGMEESAAPLGSEKRQSSIPIFHEILIVIRGSRKTGKTSLLRRMKAIPFQSTYKPTRFLQSSDIIWNPISRPNEAIRIFVWDVVDKALQVDPSIKMTKQYPDASNTDTLSRADGIIVMYDNRNEDSAQYAASVIQEAPPETPLIVLANFCDEIEHNHVHPVLTPLENKFYHISTSMKNNIGLAELATWLDYPMNASLQKLYALHLKDSRNKLSQLMEEFHQSGFDNESVDNVPQPTASTLSYNQQVLQPNLKKVEGLIPTIVDTDGVDQDFWENDQEDIDTTLDFGNLQAEEEEEEAKPVDPIANVALATTIEPDVGSFWSDGDEEEIKLPSKLDIVLPELEPEEPKPVKKQKIIPKSEIVKPKIEIIEPKVKPTPKPHVTPKPIKMNKENNSDTIEKSHDIKPEIPKITKVEYSSESDGEPVLEESKQPSHEVEINGINEEFVKKEILEEEFSRFNEDNGQTALPETEGSSIFAKIEIPMEIDDKIVDDFYNDDDNSHEEALNEIEVPLQKDILPTIEEEKHIEEEKIIDNIVQDEEIVIPTIDLPTLDEGELGDDNFFSDGDEDNYDKIGTSSSLKNIDFAFPTLQIEEKNDHFGITGSELKEEENDHSLNKEEKLFGNIAEAENSIISENQNNQETEITFPEMNETRVDIPIILNEGYSFQNQYETVSNSINEYETFDDQPPPQSSSNKKSRHHSRKSHSHHSSKKSKKSKTEKQEISQDAENNEPQQFLDDSGFL